MSDSSALLRDAWNSSTGNAGLDALLRSSLAANASQDPGQRATLRSLQLAGRSQLDLHLSGAREDLHETSASALGAFLTRVSEAVKAIARSVSGMERLRGDISVLAPAMGSVRVVLVESHDLASETSHGRSREAWVMGIERMAETFVLADEGIEELSASVEDLDGRARMALRRLSETVAANSWCIRGRLVTQDGEDRELSFGSDAADRLIDATNESRSKVTERTLSGVVDAWRWSTSTMRLVPDRGASVEAFVPRNLQRIAADANAQRGTRVTATFRVFEVTSPRSGALRQSHILEHLDVEPTLEDALQADES